MFYSCNKNICDNITAAFSGSNVDFVQETKYLGVIINSRMKTSLDVIRQTRRPTFYAQANMLLCNLRYFTNGVKCELF